MIIASCLQTKPRDNHMTSSLTSTWRLPVDWQDRSDFQFHWTFIEFTDNRFSYIMLNRFKNAVNTVVGGISTLERDDREGVWDEGDPFPGDREGKVGGRGHAVKFPYSRPDFLQLNTDEVQVSADHVSRPILVPRDISRIPWCAGYAEWVKPFPIQIPASKLFNQINVMPSVLIICSYHLTPVCYRARDALDHRLPWLFRQYLHNQHVGGVKDLVGSVGPQETCHRRFFKRLVTIMPLWFVLQELV